MQTNRINGEATIDILAGQVPKTMVGLNVGGTPNQKMESAAVAVGFNCLLQPNPQGDAAVRRAIDLLEKQLTEGHMLAEVFTDSHAPIWLRAMSSLRLYSLKLRSRGGQFARLEELVCQWFEHHFACLSLGLVPSGPLANQIVLPCSRKSPELAGNMVRDVFYQLAATGKVQRPVGKNFMDLSKDRQDTAAAPLIKQIMDGGGFGPNLKRGTLPKLCAAFAVERFDDGHAASFPDGLPESDEFTATSCWVEYGSGRFSFHSDSSSLFKGEPSPFAGQSGKVTKIPPVA